LRQEKEQLGKHSLGLYLNFWRIYQQQETDYVEEKDGDFPAYEIKWNPKTKKKFPASFIEAYAPEVAGGLHPENFGELLVPGS